jgi:hypothetical protein
MKIFVSRYLHEILPLAAQLSISKSLDQVSIELAAATSWTKTFSRIKPPVSPDS